MASLRRSCCRSLPRSPAARSLSRLSTAQPASEQPRAIFAAASFRCRARRPVRRGAVDLHAAALVRIAVSGTGAILVVAVPASVEWAAGLALVITPSAIGVRELVYVKPLS